MERCSGENFTSYLINVQITILWGFFCVITGIRICEGVT